MSTHPLIATLKNLRGNARGIVLNEPLWGIPFNLYAPYVSVYMLALGLDDVQIGLIASIGLIFQVVWALLSGAITDKLGKTGITNRLSAGGTEVLVGVADLARARVKLGDLSALGGDRREALAEKERLLAATSDPALRRRADELLQ